MTELNKGRTTVLMGPVVASEPFERTDEKRLREAWKLRFSIRGSIVTVSRMEGIQVSYVTGEDDWGWRDRPGMTRIERFDIGPWLGVLGKLVNVAQAHAPAFEDEGETDFSEALELVSAYIEDDNELRYGYLSNIAMTLYDRLQGANFDEVGIRDRAASILLNLVFTGFATVSDRDLERDANGVPQLPLNKS